VLTSDLEAKVGQRRSPVQVVNACHLFSRAHLTGLFRVFTRFFRLCDASVVELLSLLGGDLRPLHVDLVGRGRRGRLLGAIPTSLNLLMLAPNTLLDAVKYCLIVCLIHFGISRALLSQLLLQLLLV